MLECIKFGNNKIKTIQVRDDCFVAVQKIGTALGISTDSLKALVRNHLPTDLRLSREYIGLDIPHDGAKVFTTITGACRLILASKHPDRFEVLDFLLNRHDELQDRLWNLSKVEYPTLDDSIPQIKRSDRLHFIFELSEPFIHKQIQYKYACLRRYSRDMKHAIKQFRDKHPNSRILLKLINDPLPLWLSNRSISCYRHFFNINRGHHDIFKIDER